MLDMMELVLKNHFSVRTTTDPEKVLGMIEDDTLLILTDREMPNLNGFELARVIKARPNPPKVLMVTGGATEIDQDEALKAGIDGFLQKPFFPKVLIDSINALIS